MASGEHAVRLGMAWRLAVIFLSAALLGACFQPLYGRHSATGGPGIGAALSAVKVVPIKAPQGSSLERLAVQTQNDLIFGLTGGGQPATPTHELTVTLTATRSTVIVDRNSLRTDVEISALDARFSLKDVTSNKVVMNSTVHARVSYDVPGSEQRFARVRGLRDAENRAAKEISEAIRARLASYFVAGT